MEWSIKSEQIRMNEFDLIAISTRSEVVGSSRINVLRGKVRAKEPLTLASSSHSAATAGTSPLLNFLPSHATNSSKRCTERWASF